jgi:membrane fusion protein
MPDNHSPARRKTLFRDAAVAHQESTWSGRVLLMRPLSFTLYTTGAMAILMILIAFVSWATYTKRELAVGFVRPESGVSTIRPMVDGRIGEIYVAEGKHVKVGDPLFSITSELEDERGSLPEQLSAEITRQIDLAHKGAENNRESLLKQKEQVASKLTELVQLEKSVSLKEALLKQKFESLKLEQERLESLVKDGLISRVQYDERLRNFLDVQIALRGVSEDHVRILSETSQTRLDLKKMDLDLQKQSADSAFSISQLNQRLIENTSEGYIVRSPTNGIVSSVLVTPSNVVSRSSNVMAILPENSRWIAELYVSTKAIGNISKSSAVYLKYDAFPYMKFGVYRGEVKNISGTILTRESLPPEVPATEPMYRILVKLDQQQISLFNKSYSLQSGMTVTAELEAESRRLVDWFLGPLYDMKRTMRGNIT